MINYKNNNLVEKGLVRLTNFYFSVEVYFLYIFHYYILERLIYTDVFRLLDSNIFADLIIYLRKYS